jgi:hypothetical protein
VAVAPPAPPLDDDDDAPPDPSLSGSPSCSPVAHAAIISACAIAVHAE